ncbi:MAG: glycosyltransferase [Chloroflexota bacterium]
MTGSPAAHARPAVVLGHDTLTEIGGAERVVAAWAERWPDAPLLTAAVDRRLLDGSLATHPLRVSPLGRLAGDKRRAKAMFPLVPLAFRALPVPAADILLTSSSAFAHHLRPRPGTLHAWYCHTPPRFLWDGDAYFREQPALGRGLGPVLAALRHADRAAAARVNLVIANSRHTAARVRVIYGREAEVLLPPVPVDRFTPTTERSGRLLVLSRLLPYKSIEVAIAAAAQAGLALDIVGEGPDRPRLERLAGPGVTFHGRLSDAEARARLARCVALLVPGREDLGITVVEAQASGRPPIALADGGATETIEDGASGFLVQDGHPGAFAAAIRRAQEDAIPAGALVAAARRLDTPVFTAALDRLLDVALAERAAARTFAGVVGA